MSAEEKGNVSLIGQQFPTHATQLDTTPVKPACFSLLENDVPRVSAWHFSCEFLPIEEKDPRGAGEVVLVSLLHSRSTHEGRSPVCLVGVLITRE
jgi:hypothetical protein